MALNYQSEEDVREYMDNIAVEYRFGCFSEKKPDVCHLLAEYLETYKKDYETARNVFQQTCDEYGYGRSCLKYGNYSFVGRGKAGTKPSTPDALTYYQKGCDAQTGDGCLQAGLLLISKDMEPKNPDQDFPKALNYFSKGCELKNESACFYLSKIYATGINRSAVADTKKSTKPKEGSDYIVEKDLKKSFSFAHKACDLKNMYACGILSEMYAHGHGTEKNETLSKKYRKIVMDMQPDA